MEKTFKKLEQFHNKKSPFADKDTFDKEGFNNMDDADADDLEAGAQFEDYKVFSLILEEILIL